MQYALLIYSPAEDTDRAARPVPDSLADQLGRPHVTGWARLPADESATTLRSEGGRVLLTDGPFIEGRPPGRRGRRRAAGPATLECRWALLWWWA
jgi:hypothetical protein